MKFANTHHRDGRQSEQARTYVRVGAGGTRKRLWIHLAEPKGEAEKSLLATSGDVCDQAVETGNFAAVGLFDAGRTDALLSRGPAILGAGKASAQLIGGAGGRAAAGVGGQFTAEVFARAPMGKEGFSDLGARAGMVMRVTGQERYGLVPSGLSNIRPVGTPRSGYPPTGANDGPYPPMAPSVRNLGAPTAGATSGPGYAGFYDEDEVL